MKEKFGVVSSSNMRSYKLLGILAMFLMTLTTFGQNEQLKNPVLTKPLYGEGVDGRIIEIPLPPADVLGSSYMYDQWRLSDLTLKSGVNIKEHWMRYDIENERMEIKNEGEISAIPLTRIKSGTWLDPETDQQIAFVNSTSYRLNDTPVIGLMELLVVDSISLLRRTNTQLLEANYVPQLAAGRRDHRLKKEVRYYLLQDNTMRELSLKWKKSIDLFDPYQSQMEEYIQEHKLNFKNIDDLSFAVKRYNLLLKGL